MDEIDFEAAFARLEETVRLLEAGGLSLEQSVALFEEGMRLAALCNQRLDSAELRIGKLISGDAGVTRGGQMRLDALMMEIDPIHVSTDRNGDD